MDAQTFFDQAKRQLHLPAATPLRDAYQFGAEADTLAQLVLSGIKTATTSAYNLYEVDEPVPEAGGYDVILNSHNVPICVTVTDQVTISPYLAVDTTHAYLEGEGDRTYAYWRRVHDDFFTSEYRANDLVFNPNTAQVVLERFHVVYPH